MSRAYKVRRILSHHLQIQCISGIGVGWIRIDRYSLMHGIIVLLFNTQVLLLVKMQAVA